MLGSGGLRHGSQTGKFMSEFSERDRRTGSLGHGMSRGFAATMPVLLVGSLAMSALGMTATTPVSRVRSNGEHSTKPAARTPRVTLDVAASTDIREASATSELDTAAVAPGTYTVRSGDTVSSIAGRYGLSTASVLALNGLSWKSLIFPRQVLILSKPAVPVAAAPTAAAPSATLASSTRTLYTILRGDTITSIARKYGVTVSAVLSANGLTAASIIYAGRSLTIPNATVTASVTLPVAVAPAAPAGTTPAQVGGSVVPLSPAMAANARTIIAVGKQRGVPSYGIIIALSAAAQESGLLDLTFGDRDSVGLFQQRPSTGWGPTAALENPTYASELFYGGPSNPNRGVTRGLLDIPGWQSMSVTQAAQAVQISAAPNAYAKWETSARAWLAELG